MQKKEHDEETAEKPHKKSYIYQGKARTKGTVQTTGERAKRSEADRQQEGDTTDPMAHVVPRRPHGQCVLHVVALWK